MRTFPGLVLIPLVGLTLLGCGSGADAGSTVPPTVATGSPGTSTTTPPAPPPTPPADTAPATQPPATSPPTAPEGPVQIDVVVGVDSGPDRLELVRVGADVTVNITNRDAADEYHIHGIELERAVDAGVMATFNFAPTAPGTYEVESHETGDVILVIVVS